MGNEATSYSLELSYDYNANVTEYPRIINHSEYRSIGYFIDGTQNLKTYNDGCSRL